jgi:hypothetical protein
MQDVSFCRPTPGFTLSNPRRVAIGCEPMLEVPNLEKHGREQRGHHEQERRKSVAGGIPGGIGDSVPSGRSVFPELWTTACGSW